MPPYSNAKNPRFAVDVPHGPVSWLRRMRASLIRRWYAATDGRWCSGVTAIEAALIMPVLLLLSFGIIEVSLLHLAASSIEGQVSAASRQIRTGNVQNSADPEVAFKDILCGGTTFIECDDLIIDVRKFDSFSDVTYPDFIDDDGEAENNEFEVPGAGETVLVRVAYRWKILTPFLTTYLGDAGGSSTLLHSAAVFRTEPYE
ncbi:MAG: TadE family protein [Rhodospirillaceae bacterium]|nr:TadE family protein [Rhodospirillaceae bacterium]MDP7055250.1 pilus assembly protein [Alphaproteobacteria bacterium]